MAHDKAVAFAVRPSTPDVRCAIRLKTDGGGVFDAGPERLSAPGQSGIPHLIVPGCVDMANFGPMDTVPMERIKRSGCRNSRTEV